MVRRPLGLLFSQGGPAAQGCFPGAYIGGRAFRRRSAQASELGRLNWQPSALRDVHASIAFSPRRKRTKDQSRGGPQADSLRCPWELSCARFEERHRIISPG